MEMCETRERWRDQHEAWRARRDRQRADRADRQRRRDLGLRRRQAAKIARNDEKTGSPRLPEKTGFRSVAPLDARVLGIEVGLVEAA